MLNRSKLCSLKSIFFLAIFCFLTKEVCATNYYVNDNSTLGDVYCSSVGSAGNNGLSPATPKLTLTDLLSTYAGSLTSGDVIYIDAGIYNDKNLNLTIAGIRILGAGPSSTVFDNAGASADLNRLFNISANNITLDNFMVQGYNYGVGGASAIQINGFSGIVLNNVLADENRPGGGAATIVVSGGASVTFTGGGSNCNSTGSVAGGGVNVEGNNNTVTFNNYSFSNNSKDFQGGSGLYVVGNSTTSVTVNNSIFSDNRNTSAEGGGAIYVSGANLTVNNTCFNNNSSFQTGGPNYGGAITVGRAATLTLSNCTFNGNTAVNSGRGGAISINTSFSNGYNGTATVNITTCSFSGNNATNGKHLYARVGSGYSSVFNVNESSFSASGLDITDGGSSSISVQNSSNPSTSGTVTKVNTLAPSTTPSTSCPVLQGSCYGIVLPTELIDFSADCFNEGLYLNWSTASEHNSDYFMVERADKDLEFVEVGRIAANGNSTYRNDYSFEIKNENKQLNYYRLYAYDIDGTKSLLKTISNENSCGQDDQDHFNSYFNGMKKRLVVENKLYNRETADLFLFNALGQLISLNKLNFEISQNSLEVELPQGMVSGIYLVKIETLSGSEIHKIYISIQ